MAPAKLGDKFTIEFDVRGQWRTIVSPIANAWSDLISIAHQIAQSFHSLAGPHLLPDCGAGSFRHHDLRVAKARSSFGSCGGAIFGFFAITFNPPFCCSALRTSHSSRNDRPLRAR